MQPSGRPDVLSRLASRLRAAGCVYAEDEAAALLRVTDDEAELERLVARREQGVPLEYLVGTVQFGDLTLRVGPGVFIPRQRSRFLAGVAIHAITHLATPTVLEAYCGVAPIGSAIAAANPRAAIHAADVSPGALESARANLPTSARLHRSDGLLGVDAITRRSFDLIVAVPPYVPATDAHLLPRDVLQHEPRGAFFAGDDGLDHVRRLTGEAPEYLAEGGRILIELGVGQIDEAMRFARQHGYVVARHDSDDGQTVVLDGTLGDAEHER